MLLFLLHLSLGSLMEECFLWGRGTDIYSNRDSASKQLSRNKEEYFRERENGEELEKGKIQKGKVINKSYNIQLCTEKFIRFLYD